MGVEYQMHRASVDTAKGFRQFQKADNELSKDNFDSAVIHLNKGLDCFSTAIDHIAKAEDDAYSKAGSEIDQGNNEMRKSIDDYANGDLDSGQRHYAKALDKYDEALDLID